MSELVIITPDVAAGAGGVADHTLALLQRWKPVPGLTLLTPNPEAQLPQSTTDVKRLATSKDSILDQLPGTDGKVFVQYSAYGFNRFGYARELIAALLEWKKRNRG